MDIEILKPENDTDWNLFLEGSANATHYHLSEWRRIIEGLFNHQTCYFFGRSRGGIITGVLPLVRLKSHLFGDYMVSMPYLNYGSAVGNSDEIEDALINHACEFADEAGVEHIEFRDVKQRNDDRQVRTDKITMILELPESEDELWKKLGSKRRAQIKRPLRESPRVQSGGTELLDDFYNVFAITMRDLGTPVYSKQLFRMILETFQDSTRLLLIYLDNKPVSGAFLIGYKNKLDIPWACTLHRVNPLGVNMLLYWEVLKYAIQSKYRFFDFGRSTVNSGTYRFKKQWGAEEKQLYWYYWLRKGEELPALTPDNKKFRLAIAIWKKLPVPVTRLIGPSIVKNLP